MHGSPLPDISRPSGFLSHKPDTAPVAELVTEAEEYVRASDPLMAGMGDGKGEPWVPERFVEFGNDGKPLSVAYPSPAVQAKLEAALPENKRMTPKDMALRAADLISGGRAHVHGDFRKNHANIAASWSWYLQARFAGAHVIQLTAHDAALMLELFKIARTLTGAHNPDDYVDAIGYAAIAGGIAEQDAEIGDKIEVAERAK
jgi:hypothetical protein